MYFQDEHFAKRLPGTIKIETQNFVCVKRDPVIMTFITKGQNFNVEKLILVIITWSTVFYYALTL